MLIRTLYTLTSFCLALLAPLPGAAQSVPGFPELPVRGYILIDFDSGKVLAEKNATIALEPASITKIMSAYVIYSQLESGAIQLTNQVTISANARAQIGSRMFVEIGSKVAIQDLLLGVVVQSGNDATVALAEHIAGSELVFAQLMNKQAAALGMKNSHFLNSTGLPAPEHITTAADIAILARALIRDFPDHYKSYAIRDFTYNGIAQKNRNGLLWRDDSVDGLKTGHTNSAGYCLAASAKRAGMRLISVVLGAENIADRESASQQLLDYGFRFFETFKLYESGQSLTDLEVWQGEKDRVKIGFRDDVFVTIPRGRYSDMAATLELPDLLQAPLAGGQPIGSIRIDLDGKTIANPSLVAAEDILLGGFIDRLSDSLVLKFRGLLD